MCFARRNYTTFPMHRRMEDTVRLALLDSLKRSEACRLVPSDEFNPSLRSVFMTKYRNGNVANTVHTPRAMIHDFRCSAGLCKQSNCSFPTSSHYGTQKTTVHLASPLFSRTEYRREQIVTVIECVYFRRLQIN